MNSNYFYLSSGSDLKVSVEKKKLNSQVKVREKQSRNERTHTSFVRQRWREIICNFGILASKAFLCSKINSVSVGRR